MKVHEHSSTSVINREALELHTKRNLKRSLACLCIVRTFASGCGLSLYHFVSLIIE